MTFRLDIALIPALVYFVIAIVLMAWSLPRLEAVFVERQRKIERTVISIHSSCEFRNGMRVDIQVHKHDAADLQFALRGFHCKPSSDMNSYISIEFPGIVTEA